MRGKLLGTVLVLTGLAACANVSRPARNQRPGTAMTAVVADSQSALFAKAVAALRDNGFTVGFSDPGAGRLTAENPRGTSIVIQLTAAGDSTRVAVTGQSRDRGPGMDHDAMAAVLAISSAIAPRPIGEPPSP